MIPYPVAILCGGLSTRLGDMTKNTPKALLVVAGRPFIDWQLELLKKNGFFKVVICAAHFGDQIKSHVGDGARYGLEVVYSFDGDMLLGTGGALKKALPYFGDSFFVMYGDSYLDTDIKKISDYYSEQKTAVCLITVYKNEGLLDKSNIVFLKGEIIKYDKAENDPRMKYIDYGLALLDKQCFEGFGPGQAFDLGEVFKKAISEKKAAGFEVHNRFYEVGSVAGLKETDKYLSAKTLTPNPSPRGRGEM
ncbi:MAG: sugar phosphate nucleotidyltransferase [Candidatus Margulisiibacteriota bacterium]